LPKLRYKKLEMQDNKELDEYPKFYLYKRIVQAKLFIDNNSADNIDLDKISNGSPFHN
jgi:hypothetical protein